MLYFWHWWQLCYIMLVFYNGVLTYSENLCTVSDSSGLRTWGTNCDRMCHCIHEEACNSRGYCVNGCMPGWTRLTPRGSCSIRILNNSTPTVTVFAGSNYENNNNIRVKRSEFLGKYTPIHGVSRDGNCINDESGLTIKSVTITADPPILLREFAVIFKVQPRAEDITEATFSVRNFEQIVTHHLKHHSPDTINMLSVKSLQRVLVDSIVVTVTTITSRGDCSPAVIDGFFLVGKPICAYGKWGVKCERNCSCRCKFLECHPSSGRCLENGLVCPGDKFGQFCSDTCSTGCFGSTRECHPLTGQCKVCEDQNMTGVSCTSTLTDEQVIPRDNTCKDTDDSIHASSSLYDLNKSTQSQKNNYGVAIIVLVFLIVFIIICCSYVQTVQYCAKRRMRDQLTHLEEARRRQSSMATYTEFKKEFMEMENVRKSNLTERIRFKEEEAAQPISQEKQVACVTAADSRMCDSSKPRALLASKIRPSSNAS